MPIDQKCCEGTAQVNADQAQAWHLQVLTVTTERSASGAARRCCMSEAGGARRSTEIRLWIQYEKHCCFVPKGVRLIWMERAPSIACYESRTNCVPKKKIRISDWLSE